MSRFAGAIGFLHFYSIGLRTDLHVPALIDVDHVITNLKAAYVADSVYFTQLAHESILTLANAKQGNKQKLRQPDSDMQIYNFC